MRATPSLEGTLLGAVCSAAGVLCSATELVTLWGIIGVGADSLTRLPRHVVFLLQTLLPLADVTVSGPKHGGLYNVELVLWWLCLSV